MECYSIGNRKRWPKEGAEDEPRSKPVVLAVHLFIQSANIH